MRKLLLAATLMALGSPIAVAATLSGEVSINGSDDFTDTSVTFLGAGNVGGTQGDFIVLPNCTGCVTMAAAISPSFSGTLFTIDDAGHTSSMDLTAPLDFTPGGTALLPNLTVTGSGSLSLDGLSVPGTVELTTQGSSNELNVTFSATAVPTPIPEPIDWVVLATGLIGLGVVRYARRTT